jgi:hypothetical protein
MMNIGNERNLQGVCHAVSFPGGTWIIPSLHRKDIIGQTLHARQVLDAYRCQQVDATVECCGTPGMISFDLSTALCFNANVPVWLFG